MVWDVYVLEVRFIVFVLFKLDWSLVCFWVKNVWIICLLIVCLLGGWYFGFSLYSMFLLKEKKIINYNK